jgi:hypothetical protein
MLILAAGCASTPPGGYYEGTASVWIKPGESFVEGRLAAIREAEKRARDAVLAQVIAVSFPNGVSLEKAAIMDPYIRAKLYDTVRSARIAQKTVDEEGQVTITVELERRLLESFIADPQNQPNY